MQQYQESEPPYRLPDGLNVFSWSLPFLAEKVSSMLYTIIKKCQGETDDEDVDINKIMEDGKKPLDEKKKKLLNIKMKI